MVSLLGSESSTSRRTRFARPRRRRRRLRGDDGLLGGGGVLGASLRRGCCDSGRRVSSLAAFAASAAGLALAGAAPLLAFALAGMAVAGAGRGLGDVAKVTLIQARAANEVRSRVFAAQDGAAHVAFSVSAFTGGLLVEATSARGAFAVAALLGAVAAALAWSAD